MLIQHNKIITRIFFIVAILSWCSPLCAQNTLLFTLNNNAISNQSTKSSSLSSNNPRAIRAYEQATIFFRKQMYTETIATLQKITDGPYPIDIQFLEAYQLEGDSYLITKRPTKAIQAYRLVLNINPNYLDAKANTLRAYVQLQGLSSYSIALARDVYAAVRYHNNSPTKERIQNFDAQIQTLITAPINSPAYIVAQSELNKHNNIPIALDSIPYNKDVISAPKNLLLNGDMLATIAIDSIQFVDKKFIPGKTVREKSDFLMKKSDSIARGAPQRALAILRKAIAIDFSFDTLYVKLGDTYLLAFDKNDPFTQSNAISAYRSALIRNANYAEAYKKLGVLMCKMGDKNGCLQNLLSAQKYYTEQQHPEEIDKIEALFTLYKLPSLTDSTNINSNKNQQAAVVSE